MLAVVHEFFTHGASGIGCDIQHGGRLGGRGRNHDAVIHSTMIFQGFYHAGNRGSFLSYSDIDTDNILAFLIDDGVHGYRCFTGLPVTDDQLPLAAANGNNGINGFESRLEWFMNGFPIDYSRGIVFNGTEFIGFDFTFSVNGLTKGIDNAANHGFSYRNFHNTTGPLDLVPFSDLRKLTKDNAANIIFLQVHGHTVNAPGEFQKFAGHSHFQTMNPGDSVSYLDYGTYIHYLHCTIITFNLLFDN